MSGLILPNEWTSQPQTPVGIDWSNPLASRCLAVYLPANNNSRSGNPSRTVSSFGIGDTFLRTSSQHITIPLVRPVSLTGKGATLIGIVNSTNLANSQCSFALTDGSSHFSVLFRGDQGGTPISGATWNAPSSSFRQFQGPAYASGVNYVVAFTADTAGNFSIYVNGVLQSGSYSNSGTMPSGNLTTLEIGSSNGTGDYLTGSVFGAIPFEGVLNLQEIRNLSNNLWQIFKAPARRIWVAGAASGSTGTVAVTNANDTSSASGTTTVVGTVARTNANDTSSASGTTTVVGTVSVANAADTSSASGTTTVTGTSATTNANDTSTASGTTTVIGTAASTNANDTAAASGIAGSITGTVATTNKNDTVLASGTAGSLRTNRGGGWETYVAPIRKKTVKEVKKEFENLTYSEIVDEQKTAEIKIQHTQAKIQEIKSNVSAVKPFSLAPEIAKLKLLIAEEKIKIEALRELETKILIHAKIKKEKEKLLTDLAFIAEYLMDEDEYDYD